MVAETESPRELAVPPCPKCGSARVTLRYHGANRFGTTACSSVMSDWTSQAKGGHMHCICDRCSYDWPIPSLDAPALGEGRE